jgi:hypothetical protein
MPRSAGTSSSASAPASASSLISPVLSNKNEGKDGGGEKTGGVGRGAGSSGVGSGLADSYRLKVQNNSSRVGSSSDPSNPAFAPMDPTSIARDRDDPLCSDSERLSSKNHSSKKRPRKKSRSSPKKTKIKREPPETYHATKVNERSSSLSYFLCYPFVRNGKIAFPHSLRWRKKRFLRMCVTPFR